MSGEFPQWGPGAARHLAWFAHTGQVDKAGAPYIEHPLRVVARLTAHPAFAPMPFAEQDTAVMVAWLHDVIEDTAVTYRALEDLGCPEGVLSRVWALTRQHGIPPEVYYANIAADPIALLVKECDIADNADRDRLSLLDDETRERLTRKYAAARAALGRSRWDCRCDALGIEP